jgi:hypothetical protein
MTTAAIAPAEPKTITIRLDVTYAIKEGGSIMDAMEAARVLKNKAMELGNVEAVVVLGRQKLPL